MGKIERFQIILQRETPVYYPGETVIGRIEFKVVEWLKCNSIKMLAKGELTVDLSEYNENIKSFEEWKSEEKFFEIETIFIETKSQNELYLKEGEYSYPFEIELPKNASNSFAHTNAKITYWISAKIDIPWAIDKHTARVFSVIQNVDLNQLNESQKQPNELDNTFHSNFPNFWCCLSGSIYAKLKTPRTGYLPGECISFEAYVDNKTNRSLQMSVAFMQVLKAKGKKITISLFSSETEIELKTKTFERHVVQLNYSNKIKPGLSQHWNQGEFLIPTICPSFKTNLLEVSYKLVFTFGRWTNERELVMPIVIGNVPLNSEKTNFTRESCYEHCFLCGDFIPDNLKIDENEEQDKEQIEEGLKLFHVFYK